MRTAAQELPIRSSAVMSVPVWHVRMARCGRAPNDVGLQHTTAMSIDSCILWPARDAACNWTRVVSKSSSRLRGRCTREKAMYW